MRTKTIDFKEFITNDRQMRLNKTIVAGAATITGIATPIVSLADEGTFNNLHRAVMNAFDAGVVLVIIFAGASWSLGHRTKAIEILIGVCCGYLIARKSIDIRDFLKGI